MLFFWLSSFPIHSSTHNLASLLSTLMKMLLKRVQNKSKHTQMWWYSMDMLLILLDLTSIQHLILESVIFSWCIQHHLYFSGASIASLACSFFIFLFIPSILLSNLPSFYHPFFLPPFLFPSLFPSLPSFSFFLEFYIFLSVPSMFLFSWVFLLGFFLFR